MKRLIKNLIINIICLFVIFYSANVYGKNVNKIKKIYVVHSYNTDFDWVRDINKGIKAALEGRGYESEGYKPLIKIKHQLKLFYMDAKKNYSEEYLKEVSDEFIGIISKAKPDVLVVSDEDATLRIGSHFLNTNIPVVFCGLNGDPIKYHLIKSLDKPGTNITGVLERHNYKEIIKLAKLLVPNAKSTHIVFDNSSTTMPVVEDMKRQLKDSRITVKGITITNSYEEWKNTILNIQNKVDFICPIFYFTLKDKDGKTIPVDTILQWYFKNSKIPDFVAGSFQVKSGFLGSVSIKGFSHGFEAIDKAIKILQGLKPADIPVSIPQICSIDINQERAKMLHIRIPFELLTYATIHPKMGIYDK